MAFSDNFTGAASGADIATDGAGWTAVNTGTSNRANISSVSGKVSFLAATAATNPWYYTTTTTAPDQYFQVTLGATSNSGYGAGLRLSGSGATTQGYLIRFGPTAVYVDRLTSAGVLTLAIATFAATEAAGNVIKVQVVGSTITAFQNGAQIGTPYTDATPITSGSPGLYQRSVSAVNNFFTSFSSDAIVPNYTGTGAPTISGTQALAGTGTSTLPAFTGTGTPTVSGTQALAGTGVTALPGFTGTGTLTISGTQVLSGTGVYSIPNFTGTGLPLVSGSQTLAGTGAYLPVMTTVLSDNFVGTGILQGRVANNQQWQIAGTSIFEYKGWTVSASGLAVSSGSYLSVAYANAGGADHFVTGSTVATNFGAGIVVRFVDKNNFILLCPYNATQWLLRKYVGGANTDIIVTVPGSAYTPSDVFMAMAVGNTVVTIYKNGVQFGSYTFTDTIFQGATKAGLYVKGSYAAPAFTNVAMGVVGTANALTESNSTKPNAILQRDPSAVTGGANVRTHPASLYYSGATPASVQWKLVNATDSSLVSDWAAYTGLTIASGAITGAASIIPANAAGGAYRLLTRTLDASSNVLATLQSVPFSVGANFDCGGQSNMADIDASSGGPAFAGTNSLLVVDIASGAAGWCNFTGYAAAGELGNALSAQLNCPTGLTFTAVAGTGITNHCPAGTYNTLSVTPSYVASNGQWNNELYAVAAMGDIEGILWDLGESAPYPGADPSGHTLAYAARTSALRTQVGRTAAQLAAFNANISAPAGGQTDAVVDVSRSVIASYGTGLYSAAIPNVWLSHDTVSIVKKSGDLHMLDGGAANGLIESAARFARSVGYLYGTSTVDGRGPVTTGAFTQNTGTFVVTVPFALRGHANLTGSSPLQGWAYQTADGVWHDGGSEGDGTHGGPTDAAISGTANVIFTASGPVQAVAYGRGIDPFNAATILADNSNIVRGTVLADPTISTLPVSAEPTRSNLNNSASNFTGNGAPTVSGTQVLSGTGVSVVSGYSGVGALAVSGAWALSGTGLSATSNYTGAGTLKVSGSPLLAGTGSAALAGYAGTGTLTVSGTQALAGTGFSALANFTGSGTIVFGGAQTLAGLGAAVTTGFIGTGTLNPSGGFTLLGNGVYGPMTAIRPLIVRRASTGGLTRLIDLPNKSPNEVTRVAFQLADFLNGVGIASATWRSEPSGLTFFGGTVENDPDQSVTTYISGGVPFTPYMVIVEVVLADTIQVYEWGAACRCLATGT